jgi:uncharacterized protein
MEPSPADPPRADPAPAIPSAADTVAFLQHEAWPGVPVETVETHMSWVFLVGDRAYKFKKPVVQPYLDYRTLEQRRIDCESEVDLNRTLAPGIYLGLERLTLEASGRLRIEGSGDIVEWLVVMRRLDRTTLLDQRIESGSATADDLDPVLDVLVSFYAESPRFPMDPASYRGALTQQVRLDVEELARPAYGLPVDLVHDLGETLLGSIARSPEVAARADQLVDGHGDLRPEHVRPGPDPLIIDRISFDPMLRRVDPYFDLALLGVECERLGATALGNHVLEGYRRRAGDAVSDDVLDLYRALRSTTRARLSIAHRRDQCHDRLRWTERCMTYLGIASRCALAGRGT